MVKGVCELWFEGLRGERGEAGGLTKTCEQRRQKCAGRCGVPVAESALAPPGPIPNPVVTQRSAGEYCSGDAVGGEAAAGAPHRRVHEVGTASMGDAGWSSGSSLGS